MDLAASLAVADVFALVVNALMDAKKAGVRVEAAAIGVPNALRVNVRAQQVLNLKLGAVLDALGADIAAAFHKANNFHLAIVTASLNASAELSLSHLPSFAEADETGTFRSPILKGQKGMGPTVF